jgi:hypothetical protein
LIARLAAFDETVGGTSVAGDIISVVAALVDVKRPVAA